MSAVESATLVALALETKCPRCDAPRGELCHTNEFLVHSARVTKATTKRKMSLVA